MLEKINSMLIIEHDKALHAFYGLFVYSIVSIWDPLVAILLVAVQAVGKEAYDFHHPDTHTVDRMDVAYTFVPVFIVYLAYNAFNY